MKRRLSITEILSVAFVRFSAVFTMAALCLILGYIIWNGLFFSNRYEYEVLSHTGTSFDGSVLVVNKKLQLKEIPFDLMRNLFNDEYSTWKQVDKQNIDLYAYISDELVPTARTLLAIKDPGVIVEFPGSAEATVRAVMAKDGGVALVDEKAFDSLDASLRNGVKRVRVRGVTVAVNPEVVALKDNHRVGTIDESSVADIYAGKIPNWKAFDGSDIPVVVIMPPEGSILSGVARELEKKAQDKKAVAPAAGTAAVERIRSDSLDEYYSLIASTPGAVGVAMANTALNDKIPTIKVARVETGRNLDLAFLLEPPTDSGKIGGISTIILNTFAMIFLTLLFSIPPGLFAAIYLVEYARDGRLMRLIRLGTETLAGIPSIIFGLFGMLVFVQGFGWGISLLSGSLTVTLMILPTLVRTAEEALKAIPRSLQEGSLALGATKIQTIFRVVLPAAFPAIASGVILAIGRALGETAALIYTMGSNYKLTSGLFDSTRTLAVHIYLIIAEGISSDRAFASATVLVFFILIINTAARVLINRVGRMARA